MKRHLVWFETPDATAPSDAEPWTTRDIERRQRVVDTLRGDELTRLQRAVILDPTVRATHATTGTARRARARKPSK